MPEFGNADKKSKEIRVGLTLSVKLLQNVKSLYYASSRLLFPYEISFSDFVNLILKASTYGIYPPAPQEENDETTFYSLRIPPDLKDIIVEPFTSNNQGTNQETWKELPPIDFNKFVKNQFLRSTTEEGKYLTLGYIWYLELILELLKKENVNEEPILRKGILPDAPNLYADLYSVLAQYISAYETLLNNKDYIDPNAPLDKLSYYFPIPSPKDLRKSKELFEKFSILYPIVNPKDYRKPTEAQLKMKEGVEKLTYDLNEVHKIKGENIPSGFNSSESQPYDKDYVLSYIEHHMGFIQAFPLLTESLNGIVKINTTIVYAHKKLSEEHLELSNDLRKRALRAFNATLLVAKKISMSKK